MRGPAWPYLFPLPFALSHRPPSLSLSPLALRSAEESVGGGTTSDPSPSPAAVSTDQLAGLPFYPWLATVLGGSSAATRGVGRLLHSSRGRRGARGLLHADAAPPHAAAARARRLRLGAPVARRHVAPYRCGLARRHAALHEHQEQPARLLLQWGQRLLLSRLILVLLHGSSAPRSLAGAPLPTESRSTVAGASTPSLLSRPKVGWNEFISGKRWNRVSYGRVYRTQIWVELLAMYSVVFLFRAVCLGVLAPHVVQNIVSSPIRKRENRYFFSSHSYVL